MMTGQATANTASEAIKLGAYEYLTKPFCHEEMLRMCRQIMTRRELVGSLRGRALQNQLNNTHKRSQMVAHSHVLLEVLELAKQAAPRNTTILIQGESGTGKEELARFIHENGPNPAGPFIGINCGAIPDNLIASELFGHEKGSFTGASSRRDGAFVRAQNGTLLLDEIGDVPPQVQVHLLRVIESKEVLPVGGSEPVPINVRLIAATHRNIPQLIREGAFREDLFFRINVFPLTLPPLRERPEDIHKLTQHFLQLLGEDSDLIPRKSVAAMEEYNWPGNIRELRNIVENLVIRSRGEKVEPELVRSLLEPLMQFPPVKETSSETLADYEIEKIKEALLKTKGNKSKAASILGISRSKLYSRIKMLGLEEE